MTLQVDKALLFFHSWFSRELTFKLKSYFGKIGSVTAHAKLLKFKELCFYSKLDCLDCYWACLLDFSPLFYQTAILWSQDYR